MDARIWGATPAECAAHYPCDDLGFTQDDTYFRAVDVAAEPALVLRWLRQLRVAPYSYDWLDNFGRRSPPRLTPDLEPLTEGCRVMTIFRVVAVAPDTGDLTIRLASAPGRALMGDFAGTYRVAAAGTAGSRLIAKVLVRYPDSAYGRLLRRAMPRLDLVMFRKQLLTLKRYAERDSHAAGQSGAMASPLSP
jgi:hypothetical protein